MAQSRAPGFPVFGARFSTRLTVATAQPPYPSGFVPTRQRAVTGFPLSWGRCLWMVGTCKGRLLRALCQGAHSYKRVKNDQPRGIGLTHSDFRLTATRSGGRSEGAPTAQPGPRHRDFTASPAFGVQNRRDCALSEDHGEKDPWR